MTAKRQIPAITSEIRRISPALVSILEPLRQRVQELTGTGSSRVLTRGDLVGIKGFEEQVNGDIVYVPIVEVPDVSAIIEQRFNALADSSEGIFSDAQALFAHDELNTALNEVFASAFVFKVDVNGHIAGIGAAIEGNSPGVATTSRVIIQADQFAMTIPSPYWRASQAYALNQFVSPNDSTGFIYEATNVSGGGLSGTTEPTWPTVVDTTVVDNEVTWTARELGRAVPFQVGSVGGEIAVGINGNLLIDGTVTAGEIVAGSITTDKLAAGAVTADKIAANAITASKIAAGAVDTASLAALAVVSGTIAAGAVDTGQLASNAVDSSIIAAGAVDTSQLALDAVDSTIIADGAVDTSQLALDAVDSTIIADGAVDTAQLALDAVDAGRIAANSVNSSELVDASIISDKIAANAILAVHILAGIISADKIAANTITASQIAANTILAGQIAAGTITANEIAAGTITAAQILAGTITASEIAAGTITASEIAANTITASEIAADAVTADKIDVATLSAIAASLGTITAGLFQTDVSPNQRLEIDADGAYPIWYGSGTPKNDANADFYLDSAGNGFFGGTLAVNGVVGDNIVAGAVSISSNASGSFNYTSGTGTFEGDAHTSAGNRIEVSGGLSMGMIGGIGNTINGNSWTIRVRRRIDAGAWTTVQTFTIAPPSTTDEQSGFRVGALGADSKWSFSVDYISTTTRDFFLAYEFGDTPGAGDIEYDIAVTNSPTTSAPATDWLIFGRIATLEIKK